MKFAFMSGINYDLYNMMKNQPVLIFIRRGDTPEWIEKRLGCAGERARFRVEHSELVKSNRVLPSKL